MDDAFKFYKINNQNNEREASMGIADQHCDVGKERGGS